MDISCEFQAEKEEKGLIKIGKNKMWWIVSKSLQWIPLVISDIFGKKSEIYVIVILKLDDKMVSDEHIVIDISEELNQFASLEEFDHVHDQNECTLGYYINKKYFSTFLEKLDEIVKKNLVILSYKLLNYG